jgi:hypothetical protein
MADKRISQLIERVDIENNDVLPIVASGATTTNKVTISSIQTFMQGNLDLGVTSVGLSMPSAFSVTNSPVTGTGNISVTGAGTTAQYIRGDGSLADFPASSGGGSSVSYYLNGSVSQGTIGGVDYQELSKVPILGAGTDFTINANGYIASFITDIFEPNLLEIPGGNWNFETYFQASSGGGSPTFYVELYKVSYPTGTATLIATSSGSPELIAFGTNLTPYFSTLAVPTTALALTDRLAIRYYVTHAGRTITMHTENNTLCQIITTFSTGLTALNGLTAQVQNFATGTNGTDFNIESASTTHVFNLPTASGTNRGALSSTDWTTFNGKVGGTGANGQVAFWNGTSSQTGDNGLFWDNTNKRLGVGTNAPLSSSVYINNSANGIQQHLILKNSNIGSNAQVHLDLHNNAGGSDYAAGASLFFCSTTTASPYASALGFWNYQNGPIALATNALERMRVSSGGNVLINTTTDAGFRLDVNGTARVQGATTIGGTTTGVSLSVLGSGGRGGTISPRADGLGAAGLVFSLQGNTVGTFLFNADILPVNRFVQNLGTSGEVWGTVWARTFRGRDNTSEGTTNLFSGTTSNPLILGIGGTENMRFSPTNGNVLINTTTDAGFRLDVNGTARVQGVLTTTADAVVNGVSFGRGGGNSSTSTVLGNSALSANTTGIDNTAIGSLSLTNITSGNNNIAFGRSSGRFISDSTTFNTISNNSIFLGWRTKPLADNQTNQIVIGYDSTGLGSNTTVIGNSSTTFGRWFGNLLVGTSTNAGFALDVNGTARVQGELTVNGVNIGIGGGAITSNTRVGTSALASNTTGVNNVANGFQALQSNTTGVNNLANGYNALQLNTTGGSNTVNGSRSLQNNTTGSNNIAIGTNSGRFIADGTTALTIASNSVFLGFDSRANADNQTNQIVIGHTAIGLGSNTTVLGNSSTTHGRWFGNLLVGTSTNNGTNLRVVGTTQSDIITQNLASHGKKVLQYTSVSSTTINLPTEFPLMTGLVVANSYAVFGKFLGKYLSYGQAIEFYISKNPNGTWNTVAYSDSSQFIASLVSVTGSGNDLTITTSTDTSFILELTVMTQA